MTFADDEDRPDTPEESRMIAESLAAHGSAAAIQAEAEARALDRDALAELRAKVIRLRVDEIVGAPPGYEAGWNEATARVLAYTDALLAREAPAAVCEACARGDRTTHWQHLHPADWEREAPAARRAP